MGSGDVLKLGYVARNNQQKIHDAKIELYTTYGQGARPIAEDIIAYCQLKLLECTKNDIIEIVKRNITNLFEDVDDPFADDFDIGSPTMWNSKHLQQGGIGAKGHFPTSTGITGKGNPVNKKGFNLGGDFDYYNENDGS